MGKKKQRVRMEPEKSAILNDDRMTHPAVLQFRKTLKKEFDLFAKAVPAVAEGRVSVSQSWKDYLANYGSGFVISVIGVVVGVLSGLSIISLGLTAALGVIFAALGVLGVWGYQKIHEKQKMREYQRAADLIDRPTYDTDVDKIIDILAKMYVNQIINLTKKDANHFATACFAGISHNLLKNKKFNFEDLLEPALLQGALVSAVKHVPKIELNGENPGSHVLNTRSLLYKPGLYSRDKKTVYRSAKTKDTKYGLIAFPEEKQLREYSDAVFDAKKGKEKNKWKFKKEKSAKARALREKSIFSPREDEIQLKFKEKETLVRAASDCGHDDFHPAKTHRRHMSEPAYREVTRHARVRSNDTKLNDAKLNHLHSFWDKKDDYAAETARLSNILGWDDSFSSTEESSTVVSEVKEKQKHTRDISKADREKIMRVLEDPNRSDEEKSEDILSTLIAAQMSETETEREESVSSDKDASKKIASAL